MQGERRVSSGKGKLDNWYFKQLETGERYRWKWKNVNEDGRWKWAVKERVTLPVLIWKVKIARRKNCPVTFDAKFNMGKNSDLFCLGLTKGIRLVLYLFVTTQWPLWRKHYTAVVKWQKVMFEQISRLSQPFGSSSWKHDFDFSWGN